MKDLKTYLEDLFATPMNTVGMGNPSAPRRYSTANVYRRKNR